MSNSRPDQGFLFFAEGDRYVAQFERSAASLRAVTKDAQIAFATTDPEVEVSGADHVLRIAYDSMEHPKVGKIRAIASSPFRKTIFVDTDTIFSSDVSSVFDALDHFGIAITHAPYRPNRSLRDVGLADCLPQLNTGFLGMNLADPSTRELVDQWESEFVKLFEQDEYDQFSFNRLLYSSQVRFTVLPPEYNFRAEFSHQAKGRGIGVKMIHSHTVNEMPPRRQKNLVSALSIRSDAVLFKRRNQYHLDVRAAGTTVGDVAFVARNVSAEPVFRQFEMDAKWRSVLSATGLARGLLDLLTQGSEPVEAVWIGPAGGDEGLLEKLHSDPNVRLQRSKGGPGLRAFAEQFTGRLTGKTARPGHPADAEMPAIFCLIATRAGQAHSVVSRVLSSDRDTPSLVYVETAVASCAEAEAVFTALESKGYAVSRTSKPAAITAALKSAFEKP